MKVVKLTSWKGREGGGSDMTSVNQLCFSTAKVTYVCSSSSVVTLLRTFYETWTRGGRLLEKDVHILRNV